MARASLSVIVPVRPGRGDPCAAYLAAREGLRNPAGRLEFVFVLEGGDPADARRLAGLGEDGVGVRVFRLAGSAGAAAATRIGLRHASGEVALTLPADLRIDPEDLPRIVAALDRNDLVLGVRRRRRGSPMGRLKRSLYGAIAGVPAGAGVRDHECVIRAGRREVFEEVPAYAGGDRFLAVVASRLGFRVAVVDVDGPGGGEPAASDESGAGGLLDLLSIFFLARFSRRPLRFFGLIGAPLFVAGLVAFLHLVHLKLARGEPLANRPLLLLSVLLVVLGAQIVALGLVAEIIVFTHLRDVKEYSVEEIVGE